MNKELISPDSFVTLHFELRFENGEIIDSNFTSDPARFRMGDGSLLPGFEEQLIGMQEGEEREVTVASATAFGDRNPANVRTFERSAFERKIEVGQVALETGVVISFRDAANGELPGVVTNLTGKIVEIDFNHPLAGSDIVFGVRIIQVEKL